MKNQTEDRSEDIGFLEEFREKINQYLFTGYSLAEPSPFAFEITQAWKDTQKALRTPEFQKLRRTINEMRPRAQQLVSECGVTSQALVQTHFYRMGIPIFDLVTQNRLSENISIYFFFDSIDQAIGVLKTNPLKKKGLENVPPVKNCSVTIVDGTTKATLLSNIKGYISQEKDTENSYCIIFDMLETLPKKGDIVTVSNVKLLSGNWEIWKPTRVTPGPERHEDLSVVRIFIMRPEDIAAHNQTRTSNQTGHQIHAAPGSSVHIGDIQISRSDFRGANVNISSKLKDAIQSIGELKKAKASEKDELATLVKQLNDELQKVPAEQTNEAEKVVKRLEELLDDAKEEEPDEEDVKISGERLIKAAKNLATISPVVLSIAGQIASRLSGML